MDMDADIDAFGKNKQVNKSILGYFVAINRVGVGHNVNDPTCALPCRPVCSMVCNQHED